MYPYNNTRYTSIDNLTIYTESSTIPAPPFPFMDQPDLGTTLKYMLDRFNAKFYTQDAKFDKKYEELVNLTTMQLSLK